MKIFKDVVVHGSFELPPCKANIQRSYKLMDSIDTISIAKITTKDGQEVSIKVIEKTINKFLKLKLGNELLGKHLSSPERKNTYL